MQTANALRSVEAGMKVFDRERHEIGKVDYVQFGDDDPETPEVEASRNSDLGQRNDSLMANIAKAFTADELPEEIRERLLHQGFVRIDSSGLFAVDRYIMPDQIDSVSGDSLMLNVSQDELVKRH